MKNIKYFKYKNTYNFEKFLKECGYKIDDVSSYSVIGEKRYNGNILKEYTIFFSDHDHAFFKVVYFKSLNECDRSRLGFNGNTLLEWYQDANVIKYKVKDVWGLNDKYVIAM